MRSPFFIRRCITGLLAGVVLALPAAQAWAESTYVTKGSKAESLESCVAPTSDIRINHMDYMVHGRDDTVRDGDRTGKFSLSGCIDCHAGTDASGNYLPVDAEGQFCRSCHEYVAVNPPCFQCHRTTPRKDGKKLGHADSLLKNAQQHAFTMPASHISMDANPYRPAETQRD